MKKAAHPDGGFVSHFELYLEAMDAAGADRSNIQRLINELQNGKSLEESIKNQDPLVQNYLRQTFQLIERDSLTGLMASFCYGREDIIPDMFRQLIKRLSKKDPQRWRKLGFYFTEHIDCDENRHGPMARTMLERHCSQDIAQSDEAVQTAKNALLQRKQFWDEIHKNMSSKLI